MEPDPDKPGSDPATGGPAKKWVQFNEDGNENSVETVDAVSVPIEPSSVAVIETSTIEVVPSVTSPVRNNNGRNNNTSSSVVSPVPIPSTFINMANLQNVELRNSNTSLNNSGSTPSLNGNRRTHAGFTNGDVIVSILPTNTKWPWITPASFRPELVPEELMVPGLTLTVEEFVHAMELLTSDVRFNAYTICYKRLLASWVSAAFLILLIILFSGVAGIGLFALGISWLILNAGAVFLCMYIKIKINQGLERCMSRVNKLLIKHKLIVGLDDRGRISCHKVHLCFIYFDPTECVKRLDQVLDASEDRPRVQQHLDVSDLEIVISGPQNTTRIPQKQRGERLFLRYVQRWAKDFLRRRLDWTVGESSENPSAPRHLTSALCPCQYVEEYLRHKPIAQQENSCSWWLPCFPENQAAATQQQPAR